MLVDLKLSRVRLWWIWCTLMDGLTAAGRKHNPEGWQGVWAWGVMTWDIVGYCEVFLETSNTEKGIKSTYRLFNQQLISFVKCDFLQIQINVFDPCSEKRLW